jgi:Clp amino terminal domain, pathogenicity island component
MNEEPRLGDVVAYVVAQQPGADALEHLSTAVDISARLDELADNLIGHFVERARSAGASWTEIGQHMGVTKQAVQKRFVPKQVDDGDFLSGGRLRRFTVRARRVAQRAKIEAERRGDAEVRNEHVVLGLLTEPDCLAARGIVAIGAPPDRVRQAMVTALGPSSEPARGRVRFSRAAKKTLELALREALHLGHHFIGTEHILLGLLRNDTDPAAKALAAFGVTRPRAEEWILAELAAVRASRRRGQA